MDDLDLYDEELAAAQAALAGLEPLDVLVEECAFDAGVFAELDAMLAAEPVAPRAASGRPRRGRTPPHT